VNRSSDMVAGFQSVEEFGVVNGIFHGHGIHPTFDSGGVEGDGFGGEIDADDYTADGVFFGGLFVMAGESGQSEG
jgi:hypothetical protein